MNENKTEDDWPDYYKVLGEFIVNFENITYALREDSSFLLTAKGLKDEILPQIIFGQRFFTAEPLLSSYVAIVNHLLKNIPESKPLSNRLDDFRKRFIKLIQSRNDIVHSTHFFVESINVIGPIRTVTDFKAFKPNPKLTGYNLKRTLRSEIVEYSKLLKELKKEFKLFKEDLHKHLLNNKVIQSD